MWIGIAFICGWLVRLFGLPPLIGFLFAGFILNFLGAKGGDFLNTAADLGVTLLLFSIGLKLQLKSLAKPEVFGVATIHMAISSVFIAAFVYLLAQINLSLFAQLDFKAALLVGFVLSFSSTVFAIKILEELGAMGSKHGSIAIGVLVVQDIAAVIFLAIATGKTPTVWAIGLLLLIPLRHVFFKILEKTGHGELLVLFGMTLALGGANVFEMVGMKGDVGALILGMMLAGHAKAKELSKSLLGFKELFLVGFFLSVGMTALPGWQEFLVAAIIILVLPFKVILFFWLFNQFYLRASTSWRTSLNLANFSEFGLIVGAVAASTGLLTYEWLAVFAIVLSVSFILSAPMVNVRDNLYQKWRHKLKPFEKAKRLSGEEDLHLNHVQAVIFGMGRMGSAAYKTLEKDFKDDLMALEIDHDKTLKFQKLGFNVVNGDVTNPDFWNRTSGLIDDLKWVLLTLPNHNANLAAADRLRCMGYHGKIASVSKFVDEEQELKQAGVDWTFNIYTEAGLGFANDLKEVIK